MDKSKNNSNIMDWEAEIRRLQTEKRKASKRLRNSKSDEKAMAAYVEADKQLSAAMQQRDRVADGKPVQLDLFPDFDDNKEVGAIPNVIARSALFIPIQRGRRRHIENEIVASRADVTIYYDGYQLDMGDSDVFLQVIRLAEGLNLGEDFRIFPYGFLVEIGRGGKKKKVGETDIDWLHRSIDRLKKGTLTIETAKYKACLSLIDSYVFDKDNKIYSLRINKEIRKLFNDKQFGLHDWEVRKQISFDYSKWLFHYIHSNKKGPQVISLEKIKGWSGQSNRRKDHYRTLVQRALKELEGLGVIADWSISKKDVLSYVRL